MRQLPLLPAPLLRLPGPFSPLHFPFQALILSLAQQAGVPLDEETGGNGFSAMDNSRIYSQCFGDVLGEVTNGLSEERSLDRSLQGRLIGERKT